MQITLGRATIENAEEIFEMQRVAFAPLLEKYGDYHTNPAAESLETVKSRLKSDNTFTYFILLDDIKIGAIRVKVQDNICNFKQILILPRYQHNGYARQAMSLAEGLFPQAEHWELDTILQEKRLCRLYTNAGYIPTGKIEKINEKMSLIYFSKKQ